MRGDQLARQRRIIRAIEASPNGLTVTEIAEREETGFRTIYRDLEALQAAGFPLYTEKVDRSNRWAVIDTFKFKIPPAFTLTEFISRHFYNVVRVLSVTRPSLYVNKGRKNHRDRFPEDFMFQLNAPEVDSLRSQIATSKTSRGGRRYAPYAFTEHGAIMLAAVLNTPRAIQVSLFVVRAFVRLREILANHKELAHKLGELERKIGTHDEAIQSLISAIRRLMAPRTESRRRIGFLRERRATYSGKK